MPSLDAWQILPSDPYTLNLNNYIRSIRAKRQTMCWESSMRHSLPCHMLSSWIPLPSLNPGCGLLKQSNRLEPDFHSLLPHSLHKLSSGVPSPKSVNYACKFRIPPKNGKKTFSKDGWHSRPASKYLPYLKQLLGHLFCSQFSRNISNALAKFCSTASKYSPNNWQESAFWWSAQVNYFLFCFENDTLFSSRHP